MLNHTYTSVNNANLVDCGKKQHISSQPSPLLKDNFLGEFRTELDKKKVLANLGIAADLVLEWENIKGDIGKNEAFIKELDARTKYISALDGLSKTLAEGIAYLETIVGGEQSAEAEQDRRLQALESAKQSIETEISNIKNYLSGTIDVSIASLQTSVQAIDDQLANINSLITVSKKEGNALELLEGETSGLYVPDLSGRLQTTEESVSGLQESVSTIQGSLDTFVTKEQLGGDGEFDFVDQSDFSSFSTTVDQRLGDFEKELEKTVKTGEDGYVKNLFVDQISNNKENTDIIITDSFEMSSAKPLDVRSVVADVSDLKNLDPNVCYAGMSVIAVNQSSIYILKAPAEGSKITSEYLKNSDNWKCPEDLVTQAITKEKYEALVNSGQADSKVFYYVYEEEIPLTAEPKREAGESEEAFRIRWDAWVASLKVLSQEYMSASWGVDIETKLGQKASAEDLNVVNSNVKQLQDEISDLKGGDSGNSLVSLGKSIEAIQEATVDIETRLNQLVTTSEEGTESGRIVAIETEVNTVKTSLNDYVTKSDLQDNTQEFIFVKTSTYQEDKETFTNQLAESVATKIVDAESINTESLSLNDANIQVDADHLTINDKPIALSEDLMQIEIIDQDTYNKREQDGTLSDKIYYYTYDGTVSLVTNTDLQRVKDDLSDLQTLVAQLQKSIAELQQIVQSSNPTE